MRVAHFADLHISDRVPPGALTLEEQIDSLTSLASTDALESCDAIVVAGDVFDRLSAPAERNAAIMIFTAWSSFAPVHVIPGNHDRAGDVGYLGHLDAEHPIIVQPSAYVSDGFGYLPWPRKGILIEGMGDISGGQINAAAVGALRGILSGFRVRWVDSSPSNVPRILIAHVELGEAMMDNGQPVAGKCDLELSADDLLATGADAILLGHIHKAQTIGDRIHYPGSPRPTAFGHEGPHGFTVVDVERGGVPTFEHRTLPGREMITITGDYSTQHGLEIDESPADATAALRLQYTVDESERGAAAEIADKIRDCWLAEGAHSVKLVPQIQVAHRVRSDDIAAARSTRDRLGAYWAARDDAPARFVSILDKLDTIESETQQ